MEATTGSVLITLRLLCCMLSRPIDASLVLRYFLLLPCVISYIIRSYASTLSWCLQRYAVRLHSNDCAYSPIDEMQQNTTSAFLLFSFQHHLC